MKRLIIGLALALTVAGAAMAGASEDFSAAMASARDQKYPEAVALLNHALTDPGVTEANRAVVIGARGNVHMLAGEYRDALVDLDTAINSGATRPYLYWARGLSKFLLGRTEDAIADYTLALAGKPGDYRTLADRGHAYAKLGRRAEAIADLDAAIRANPAGEDGRAWRAELGG